MLESVELFVSTMLTYQPDGIDLCLFNDNPSWYHVRNKADARAALSNSFPAGGTRMAPVFQPVFEAFFTDAQRKKEVGALPQPVTIVVLTDGCPMDQDELELEICKASCRLQDEVDGADEMLGTMFLQIGFDEEAAKFLQELDDKLQDIYNVPFDIVATMPFLKFCKEDISPSSILLKAIQD